MPEDQLRATIDSIRTRLQAELDAQLEQLVTQHDEQLQRVREDADTQAEQRWASKVEAIRSEWSARLDSEVTAARADAEKRLVAESMRVRVEAEQAAADAAAAQRRELEAAIAAERQRAEARLEAEHQRAEQELEAALAALATERRQADAESATASGASMTPILEAVHEISGASSLSETLTALGRAATPHGARVTVFIVNGNRLEEWTAEGLAGLAAGSIRVESPESGLLCQAVRGARAVSSASGDQSLTIPAFAGLPAGAEAVAVPLPVGGQVVAVLYADDGGNGGVTSGQRTALELLGRHAAACLERQTAVRALQLVQGGNGAALASSGAAPVSEDDQSARRYARLLVSEIKLYNESAVRLGREKRDLLERLKPEIERARRLYEERVSPAVTARGFYFHQELVQTLAGGDAGLLGAG